MQRHFASVYNHMGLFLTFSFSWYQFACTHYFREWADKYSQYLKYQWIAQYPSPKSLEICKFW